MPKIKGRSKQENKKKEELKGLNDKKGKIINEPEGLRAFNEAKALVTYSINRMHSLYVRWGTARGNESVDKFNSFSSVWLHWLHFDIVAYYKEFAGKRIDCWSDNGGKKYKYASTPEMFWGSFRPFEDVLSCVWRVRFTNWARDFLLGQKEELRMEVFYKVLRYSTGNFGGATSLTRFLQTGPCRNMVFILSQVTKTTLMVFCTELNRFPTIDEGYVVYYTFKNHMKVIDFCYSESDAHNIIKKYISSIKNNPDMYIKDIEYSDEDLFNFPLFNEPEDNYRYVNNLYYPILESRTYLSPENSKSIIFDPKIKRWIGINKFVTIDIFQSFHPLIKKLASKQAGINFVKILTNIPNFKIKLTEEQNTAVSQVGNVVILGRSGTGKTTCSILRMFAAELLFRYKSNISETKLSLKDLNKSSVLHSVFLTASPVLTNEVKRYYAKLKNNVRAELERKLKKAENKEKPNEYIDLTEVNQNNSSSDDEDTSDIPTHLSMNHLTDKDFPLFSTIRSFILMVDASLTKPFFTRNSDGHLTITAESFEWHKDPRSSIKISKFFKASSTKNKALVDSDSSSEDESENPKNFKKTSKKLRSKANKYFEVDYKVFKEKFWPTLKNPPKFSALTVWTEITSHIKGSSQSWSYPQSYLSKVAYSGKSKKFSLLNQEEKLQIWEIFMLYENWKSSYVAYDFQDLVNYILKQVKNYGYTGVPIHYMMVDEVQDLTPATIALLMCVCSEKIVFSGDTAQTIAKGASFRFYDIDSLFYEAGVQKPIMKQLTKNFRTHNQILALANSIVSLLETLFPQTIDKMLKEKSCIDGPTPLIINSNDPKQLFFTLFGTDSVNNPSEIQFGCNQVIIVRNQETKEKLHPLLSHALCLTVFESKGLEFDDVILYNFFTDSEVSQEKWKALNCISKVNTEYENNEKVEKLRCSSPIDQSKLSLLCVELKHFYVSVTRPKKNLVIFDEDLSKRKYMQQFLQNMGVVSVLDSLEDVNNDCKSIAQRTCGEMWRSQGERMMAHRFYDQAVKCFSVSGDKWLENKARGLAKAGVAGKKLTHIESLIDNYSSYKKVYTKSQLNSEKRSAEKLFIEAAQELFEVNRVEKSRKLSKSVAQCFASGKQFARAAEIYIELGLLGQAAECLFATRNYYAAGELFDKKNDYVRAIESFSLSQSWDRLIKCLHRHKDSIPIAERKKFVYKYMPVALEAAMPKLLPNEQSEHIKKIVKEQANVISEAMECEEHESDSND